MLKHIPGLREAVSKPGLLIVALLFFAFGRMPTMGTAKFATSSVESSIAQAIPSQGDSDETKLAEGEYTINEQSNDGAVGPFPEEIYNFHETWTLSHTGKDAYQVKGVRKFESPKGVPNEDPFIVDLSRDLTIIHVEEATQLKWVKDSGPLACDFRPTELSCSSGGSNPKNSIRLHVPLKNPYGLFWPISPFSLAGITREIERDPKRTDSVDLLSIEQPDAANPVQTTILEGPIRFLGKENIQTAGRNWTAYKFSLKVPMHPEFLIWNSQQGFLLAVAIEHQHKNWQEGGLRLIRFQSWKGF